MTTAFIEKQFPVSKVSKESYKERKAVQSQTITGIGKWWGRKPLILVRAVILGCLLPTSDDPRRDLEIFLKIMGMDESGLFERSDKSALDKWVRDELGYTDQEYRSLDTDEKTKLRKVCFSKCSYDRRLSICLRPEQFVRDATDRIWIEINQHCGTHAYGLEDLIQQLSEKRFGKNATIGDCFCGGGSIPFEAARLGLDIYASDLNPVAGLLTWAAINLCGASDDEVAEIRDKNGYHSLIPASEVRQDMVYNNPDDPSDPDIVGWHYKVDVSRIVKYKEKYKDMLEMLNMDDFRFKAEYIASRRYLNELKSAQNQTGDELLDYL